MFRKLINNKGNAELLAFVIVLPLILAVTLNPLQMFLNMNRYSTLEEIAKKYILVMETEGGLTADQYSNLQGELSKNKFTDNVNIDYTPYPIEFGQDVKLKITADQKMQRSNLLGGLSSETVQIVAGPYTSISKRMVQP